MVTPEQLSEAVGAVQVAVASQALSVILDGNPMITGLMLSITNTVLFAVETFHLRQ